MVFTEVDINGTSFDLVNSTLNNKGESEYELNFELQGIAYSLPIVIQEKTSLVPAGIAVSGVIAGSFYIFNKKKKTKHTEII